MIHKIIIYYGYARTAHLAWSLPWKGRFITFNVYFFIVIYHLLFELWY